MKEINEPMRRSADLQIGCSAGLRTRARRKIAALLRARQLPAQPAPAREIIMTQQRCRALKGHDFSRAVTSAKLKEALALEEISSSATEANGGLKC